MPISLTETYFLMASSLAMSSIVIANAYYQKQQFYPLVVYVTKSNASMAIIYVQGLVLVLLLGKLIGKIFFGQLRTAEVEHLIERSWYAVTETCLAFTVFRDDLSPKFVALFTLLLFLKCFHWLAEDRVDYMERSPNISMFFHMRVISLLSILGCLDITFVYLAYHSTLSKGASVQLVFGFEYAILFAVIINISMKYILHFFDLYNENPWEDKAIYLLYTELIMGLLKIGLYFIFILIMMKIHTFPLFAIRPMYLTIRGFKKALNDVIMSRRAIRNMNTFYPDATAQDIENSDNVCIICRENMVGNGSCKKLPCNHIFHISCLRSWFQRQQTCPTCRMDVLRVASTSSGANMPNQGNNNANNANNVNNANLNGQAPVPPFFAANPFVVQQLNQLMQRQNGNQPPAGNVQQAAPTPGTSGSHPSTAQASTPRVVLSPAMFPFLQSPPFPMPEVSIETLLQGFTDEQLHALEGQERRQIEARLKCLMDVKTLITAATIRLQQYNNVVLNSPPTSAISTQTEPKPEEPRNETTSNNESTNIAASSLQNSQDGGSSLTESGDQASASTSSEDSKEMIRQRRLQRFSQTQLPNLSDTPSPASDNVAQ